MPEQSNLVESQKMAKALSEIVGERWLGKVTMGMGFKKLIQHEGLEKEEISHVPAKHISLPGRVERSRSP